MSLTSPKRLPTGRGIAARFNDTWLINIYAPSGAENKRDRESFFTNDLAQLLPTDNTKIILAGDFNCVITADDCTGTKNASKALEYTVKELNLNDACRSNNSRPHFTHYTGTGASRIDRIYISQDLVNRKSNTETIIAPFTDHLAVVLHIVYTRTNTVRIHRGWKMNTALMEEKTFFKTLVQKIGTWNRTKHFYPSELTWWERSFKGNLRQLFQFENAERRRDSKGMENFYYAVLYDILRTPNTPRDTLRKINQIKAKLRRISCKQMKTILLDNDAIETALPEDITIYHYARAKKRLAKRTVPQIHDSNGILQTDKNDIMYTFESYIQNKYKPIICDAACFHNLTANNTNTIDEEARDQLDHSISITELQDAVQRGKNKKSPGPDGICNEFYKLTWDYCKENILQIVNCMFTEGACTRQQKHGSIVCLPKSQYPITPEDYRPLTLLNTDYKLLTRIIARRLKTWTEDILHTHQYCGRSGKTIYDAVAAVRDISAYAETTHTSVCLLSLDFKDAFDNISHDYINNILREYGTSDTFRRRLKTIYEGASSTIVLNGMQSKPISIECGVRQGCPLSSILFAICINPLLTTLDAKLQGIKLSQRSKKIAVIAYADDVTIILRHPHEINVVQSTLNDYSKSTGAKLNYRKSQALALGSWPKHATTMGINYENEIKILGFYITGNTQKSAEKSWSTVTSQIKRKAQESYHRSLNLSNRIRYVNEILLAPAWYTTQILPPPVNIIRQINTAITYFIWKGSIFKVPISTLQKSKREGGRALIDVQAKSKSLFLTRMEKQIQNTLTFTSDWIRTWTVKHPRGNPPDMASIPNQLAYIACFIQENAYTKPKEASETDKQYKKRIYNSLRLTLNATSRTTPMRIQTLWPETDWDQVWANILQAPISQQVESEWYQVIHDLIPTNTRLHRIRIAPSELCQICSAPDSLEHRLTNCNNSKIIWTYTKTIIATMLRTNKTHIPDSWIIRPQFKLWPEKRRNAVTWTLAHANTYCIQNRHNLSLQDYYDFLCRSRWKTISNKKKKQKVGNYLSVLEFANWSINLH